MRIARWLLALVLATWVGMPLQARASDDQSGGPPVSYSCEFSQMDEATTEPADLHVGGTGIQHDELRLESTGPAISVLLPPTQPRSFMGYGIIWQSSDCQGFPYVQDAIRFINKRFDDGHSGILIDLLNSGAELDSQPALVFILDGSSYNRSQAESLLTEFRQAGDLFKGISFSWEDGSSASQADATTATTSTTLPTSDTVTLQPTQPTSSDGSFDEMAGSGGGSTPPDSSGGNTGEGGGQPPTDSGGDTGSGGGTTPPETDCTPTTISSDSAPWTIDSQGPAVVDLTTRTGGQYKVWLISGNTLPGTGTALVYGSQACKDIAWQQYLSNPLPLKTFDELWAEHNSGSDCAPTTTSFSEAVGDFPVSNAGPSIVDLTTRKGRTVKVFVEGSVTLPGTGTAKMYPAGCSDVAYPDFQNDPLEAATFDEVWAEQNATPTPTPTTEATETVTPSPTASATLTETPTAEATPTDVTEEPTETPIPTDVPTEIPTETPTPEPTQEASAVEVTQEPTQESAPEPTQTDSQANKEVAKEATDVPTEVVTEEPASEPAEEVTEEATEAPTEVVTEEPQPMETEEADVTSSEAATTEETVATAEEPTEVATEEVTDPTVGTEEEPTETPTPEAQNLRYRWLMSHVLLPR